MMHSSLGKRAFLRRVVVVSVGSVVLISGVAAASSSNTIAITGPTKNLFHTYFNETVSGFASAPANFVISGEQLYPRGGCASTYLAERRKSDFGLWGTRSNRPGGTGPVHGSFSTVARFWARNHLEHGICSYLINRGTLQTYAHASRWWNNT
jgi:hypothetical protein